MKLSDDINRALDYVTQGAHEQQLRLAREQYFRSSGPLHDDEPSYEQRIEAFSEWYLFDYLLPGNKRPALDLFLAEQRAQLNAEEIAIYEAMRASRRGLFEYLKHKNDQVLLRDLESKKKLQVVEELPLLGMQRGQIIDARLVPYKGMLVIRSSLLIHPDAVRARLLKQAKKIRKTDSSRFAGLREALSLARLRCDRYRNVDPLRLYTQTMSEMQLEF